MQCVSRAVAAYILTVFDYQSLQHSTHWGRTDQSRFGIEHQIAVAMTVAMTVVIATAMTAAI